MRTFLNQQQMQILVNALVISSLDYCNALYYVADCYVSKQLQMLQNRACKTIFGLKRKESVSEYMKSLHWLKIPQRIDFKILLLVYKCLNGLAPQYLSELVNYNTISGSRTPSLFSHIPNTLKGSHAFQYSAAYLCNNLPLDIRQSPSLDTFKKCLKTYLFYKSYPRT